MALNLYFVPQDNQERVHPITQLAYSSGKSQTVPHRTFRQDRGKPVYRRGIQVTVTPQFKGLTLYSPTTVNTPSPGFRVAVTSKAIVWPAAQGPAR